MSSTEEERAALWRQQTANRIAFKTALWTTGLRAPPEPRQAVLDGQTPLLLAALEAQNPTDPKDDP
jgi:hypothetical protein